MKLDYWYPVWVILCACIGALLGNMTGYGTFRGMTDGVIVAMLPFFLLMVALSVMSRWRPILPPCRCGKCNHKAYRYVGSSDLADAGRQTRWLCPECERTYQSCKGRFDELLNDGRIAPYMSHTKWGRWRKYESGPPPQSS
jgi:hypothetical protein